MGGPDRTTESNLDDIQGIDLDLEGLFNKFILPIDRVRSFAAPNSVERPVIRDGNSLANNVANSSETDPSSPQESRAHAFYRMIGFPVINQNFEFYNPGYDPTLKADQRKKNYDISTKLSQVVRRAHALRETSVRQRIAVFSRADINACVYAIAIGVPNGTKPFLQMNPTENFDFINTTDDQVFNKVERKSYIEPRYKTRSGDEITNFFDRGSHILRPFNVDPNIADTVAGFSNETRLVAAPFLKTKKDTGVERNIYAKRPGIEFILRLRLRAQDSRTVGEGLLPILNYSQSTNSLSLVELTQTVSALLNDSDVDSQDIVDRLKNANNLELINLNKLVKTIKGVIDLLVNSIDSIKNVSEKIKWTPLPSENGPENGSDSTNIIVTKQNTDLEKRYLNLSVRSAENTRIGTISEDESIINSDFHLSQFESLEKPWNPQIEAIFEEINNYQKIGSDALTAIEIITGEVSGLGLIDVLAVYTALWAVDIKVLICMLDENAFDRLYSFRDLRSTDIEERRSNGPQMGIVEAIQVFERQVINILSYSDRIFNQKLGSPNNSEGGDVPMVDLGD